jgi:hypothetical protein
MPAKSRLGARCGVGVAILGLRNLPFCIWRFIPVSNRLTFRIRSCPRAFTSRQRRPCNQALAIPGIGCLILNLRCRGGSSHSWAGHRPQTRVNSCVCTLAARMRRSPIASGTASPIKYLSPRRRKGAACHTLTIFHSSAAMPGRTEFRWLDAASSA